MGRQGRPHASIQAGEIGIAQHVKPREQRLGGFVKEWPRLRRDWRSRRNGESHRILVYAVDVEFIMQVRTGCQPGTADKAHDFSLYDTPALPHSLAESIQVSV